MPAQDMPAAEVDIDEPLVRALLDEQHPDLARLPLELVANGWDNAMFRLGADLVVRLPRRQLAAGLVEHEQRWLPELAPHLPLPVPAPVRVGVAGPGYPWPWSICPWIEGSSALAAPPDDLDASAVALGGFLAALHSLPAPPDAPPNPFRGIPLAERRPMTLRFLESLGTAVDQGGLRSTWDELSAAPAWDRPPAWVHGDTHPGNLVVRDGRLVAVVDFGDLCGGDPASDLAVGWMLFPPGSRERFRVAVDADPDLWARGRAWALAIGVSLLASSADNPPYHQLAERTLAAVLADVP